MQRYELKELPIDRLMVDHDVQRLLNTGSLKKMLKEGFREDLVGVLKVSAEEDGFYHVIDGQTRLELARIKAPSHVFQCEVHHGLTKQDKARMFIDLNQKRVPVPSYEMFRVKATYDSQYAAMTAVLEKYFLNVGSTTSPHTIGAVGAVERVGRFNPEVLDRVLGLLVDRYGYATGNWNSALIRALGVIAKKAPQFKDSRMRDVLIKNLPAHWEQLATTKIASLGMNPRAGGGEAVVQALTRILIDRYNARLSPANRITVP